MNQPQSTQDRLTPLLPHLEKAELPLVPMVPGNRFGSARVVQRHGFSHEFAEHREYTPGDELRYVDWKAVGRSDRYFVKRFHDETSCTATILLDNSPGMAFCDDRSELSKFDHGKLLAGIISWILLRDHEQVELRKSGGCKPPDAPTNDDAPHKFPATLRSWSGVGGLTPPALAQGNSPAQWPDMMRQLDRMPLAKKTALDLANLQGPRRLLVLITDGMFDDADAIISALKTLKKRRYDLFFVHTLAAEEIEFPYRGELRFKAFGGPEQADVQGARIAKAYRTEMRLFLSRLEYGCASTGITYRLARTDQPPEIVLR